MTATHSRRRAGRGPRADRSLAARRRVATAADQQRNALRQHPLGSRYISHRRSRHEFRIGQLRRRVRWAGRRLPVARYFRRSLAPTASFQRRHPILGLALCQIGTVARITPEWRSDPFMYAPAICVYAEANKEIISFLRRGFEVPAEYVFTRWSTTCRFSRTLQYILTEPCMRPELWISCPFRTEAISRHSPVYKSKTWNFPLIRSSLWAEYTPYPPMPTRRTPRCCERPAGQASTCRQ